MREIESTKRFSQVKKCLDGKLLKKISSGEQCIYSNFWVWAVFEDLALLGRLDAIVFEGGKAKYIIELKTSRKGLGIFEDAIVQAQVYGLCIESMGFDCSELKLVIVKVKSELVDEISPDKVKKIIIAGLLKNKVKELEKMFSRRLRVHIEDYDRKLVEEKLEFIKDYWLELRGPHPSNNPNKCKSCYYRDLCPYG
ncbi:PD-(D/E)XK nuclease family protein [Archaeoglobus sp.]|uniref:CRISPR-associated protein Cas4 n=1 Tax=Archaeoglobus sp. TaxID=1872626 RepID=UPI0025B96437|nr:PD-(D/E)XK nuclease family protein [Archaeoglobus sp.]